MFDLQKILAELAGVFPLADIFHFFIPQAGVGGGVEAKEHVELVPVIRSTLLFLAGIGTVFGIALAFAAKKFSVTINPKVEQVMDVLAHAH